MGRGFELGFGLEGGLRFVEMDFLGLLWVTGRIWLLDNCFCFSYFLVALDFNVVDIV